MCHRMQTSGMARRQGGRLGEQTYYPRCTCTVTHFWKHEEILPHITYLAETSGGNQNSLVILTTKVKGHWEIVTKYFALSEDNKDIIKQLNQILLPNPEEVRRYMNNIADKIADDYTSEQPVNKSKSPGSKANTHVINLLQKGNWETLTCKEQYVSLGFHGGHNTLLYAKDITEVPGCPVALNKDHFIWNDIAMGKGSAFPKKTHTVQLGDKQIEVVIQKNYCAGVKQCSAPSCNYATSNKQRENKCLRHELLSLESTGNCNGVFVYVYPKDKEDRRRWLGFLTTNAEGHNHPCPITTKPGSQLVEIVADCVRRDPTKMPGDLAKGYGLPCFPGAISIAGANKSCLANIRNKYLIDTGSATAINLVIRFDVLIKAQIDSTDSVFQDENTMTKINDMTTPYLRWWTASSDLILAVFITPQLS